MPRISVDQHYCKGCGLCVEACDKGIMALDYGQISSRGYNPAYCTDQEACNGCLNCAQMCPDVAITVVR
ncbi:MAG: 4Fe-4S binding protein [Coriobacteriales bacterium]|nr:4Fe-4S binding protein [Coriobacteriales bacterium]